MARAAALAAGAGLVCLALAYLLEANELLFTALGVGLLAYAIVRLLARPKLSNGVSQAGINQMRQNARDLMRDLLRKQPVDARREA